MNEQPENTDERLESVMVSAGQKHFNGLVSFNTALEQAILEYSAPLQVKIEDLEIKVNHLEIENAAQLHKINDQAATLATLGEMIAFVKAQNEDLCKHLHYALLYTDVEHDFKGWRYHAKEALTKSRKAAGGE